MNDVIFPKEYYDYRTGFADGFANFIIYGAEGFKFMEDMEFNNMFDYGYFDACYYCFLNLVAGKKIDLSNIDIVIDEAFVQRVGEYNKFYNKEFPAYTLVLNYKK